MKLIGKFIVVAGLWSLIFSPVICSAQDLADEGQEVWESVEAQWEHLAEGDQPAFLTHFHPMFEGFVNWRALPVNKEILGDWISYMIEKTKITIYTIEPVSVITYDDVAVVQYYCDLSMSVGPGKEVRSEYRYTDVLVKENDKWLVLRAHKEKRE